MQLALQCVDTWPDVTTDHQIEIMDSRFSSTLWFETFHQRQGFAGTMSPNLHVFGRWEGAGVPMRTQGEHTSCSVTRFVTVIICGIGEFLQRPKTVVFFSGTKWLWKCPLLNVWGSSNYKTCLQWGAIGIHFENHPASNAKGISPSTKAQRTNCYRLSGECTVKTYTDH